MRKITLAVLIVGNLASISFAQNKWDNSTSNQRNYYTGGDQLVNQGYETNDSSSQKNQSQTKRSHYTGGDREVVIGNLEDNASSSAQQRYQYTGGDNMHKVN